MAERPLWDVAGERGPVRRYRSRTASNDILLCERHAARARLKGWRRIGRWRRAWDPLCLWCFYGVSPEGLGLASDKARRH